MNHEIWAEKFSKETKTQLLRINTSVENFNSVIEVQNLSSKTRETRVRFNIENLDRRFKIMVLPNFRFGERNQEIQLMIGLEEYKEEKVLGYTISRGEAVRLAVDWLSNRDYQEIYDQYTFLGGRDRLIKDLKRDLFRENLIFKNIMKAGFHFEEGFRSCGLETDFFVSIREIGFYYKSIKVFGVKIAEIKQLGALLEGWFERKWTPEKMKSRFSEIRNVRHVGLFKRWKWISKRKLEFIRSWDQLEHRYKNGPYYDPITQSFIEKLRCKKIDYKTRAGTINFGRIVISRSRNHGLRKGQKSLSFDFSKTKPNLYLNTIDGRRLSIDDIEYIEEIEKEISKLLKEPIN